MFLLVNFFLSYDGYPCPVLYMTDDNIVAYIAEYTHALA